ncbi:MAG: TRAP transporter small permease subunit [Gammaproteobacteria bacterium]|nr:TRAP transporter small permease subunit [Gammaproteobacteria bacterium]
MSTSQGVLQGLSRRLAQLELTLAGVALSGVLLLLLLNVLTRAIGQAFFWTDELAVSLMVWMAFLAASASIHHGSNIAVSIVSEFLPPKLRFWLAILVNTLVLGFFLILLWLCWRWFDLPGLAAAGWDSTTFASETFNFIYSEPTQTLGLGKIWFWLVVPWFALGGSLHALAQLRRAARRGVNS